MINDTRINVIVNIIRTLVLTLLSFITFPWVCRYLGDSAVGAYTWANTFVAYFLILAKIGPSRAKCGPPLAFVLSYP